MKLCISECRSFQDAEFLKDFITEYFFDDVIDEILSGEIKKNSVVHMGDSALDGEGYA